MAAFLPRLRHVPDPDTVIHKLGITMRGGDLAPNELTAETAQYRKAGASGFGCALCENSLELHTRLISTFEDVLKHIMDV